MSASNLTIKAVTFDLWETLLFESDGASARRATARCKTLAKTLNNVGIHVSVDQATKAMNRTISSLLKIWDRNRDVTHLDQLRYVVRFASDGKTALKKQWIPELSSACVSSLFETPPYVNPDALRTMRWLKSHHKLTGLICNTGVTPGFALRKLLSQEGVAQFFDLMLFSDEVKIRKPDPRIFRLAARKLRTKPSQMVHIGDNLKADVWGAKNAGFKVIYLAGREGRDKEAENDPKSLASLSRNLGRTSPSLLEPDKTVTSLAMVIKAIKEFETRTM